VHKLKSEGNTSSDPCGKWQEKLAEGLRTAVKKTANKVYNWAAYLLASFMSHPWLSVTFSCG